MKNLFCILLLFIATVSVAQEVELKIETPPPYKVFDNVLVEVFIVNNTNQPISYFDSRYTSWDSYTEEWTISVEGKPLEIYNFNDGHEGKYTEKSILKLMPGERRNLKSRLFKLNSSGKYQFSYKQNQSPKLIKEAYASNKSVYQLSQSISTFTVSGKLEINVADIQNNLNVNKVDMSWEKWQEYSKQKVYKDKRFFTKLEDALEDPENVYYLMLHCDGISLEMIEKIGLFVNLKRLDIGNYSLEIVPASIAKLDLYEFQLLTAQGKKVEFSEEFSLNNTIRKCQVKSTDYISPNILKVRSIEELDLRNSDLTTLPYLGNLSNLRKLNAIGNCFKNIDNSGLENITTLEEVNIGSKSPIDISPITNWTSLKSLSIAMNTVTIIPESISNLNKLQKLNLSYNDFKSLPGSVTKLTSLKEVDFSNSGITSLPEGFATLPLNKVNIKGSPCSKSNDYKILKKRLGNNFIAK
ncbi:leucine-rich repeat domain-containing protein [Marinifilum sp.]|uniref:leucine-rich repeat domain-containing protein n=1 Tax=Marinifilum sp. TaxID=2033137 RepID=UPI003BA8FB68